jgi:hypothetical protein
MRAMRRKKETGFTEEQGERSPACRGMFPGRHPGGDSEG